MKRNLKKLIVFLLMFSMTFSNMSYLSFAEETVTEETTPEETTPEETTPEETTPEETTPEETTPEETTPEETTPEETTPEETTPEETTPEETTPEETTPEETVYEYGEPEWSWSEDYTTATATFTCLTDAERTETVNAEITSEVTKEATEEEEGERTYTAAVTFSEQTYTDSVVETIPVIGHEYSEEPVWVWSEDYSTATAVFICKNNSEHTKTLEATVTSEITKTPTVEEEGEKTYTAVATDGDKQYSDTRIEVLAKHVHTPGAFYDPDTNVWSYRCKECGETLGKMKVSYYKKTIKKATTKKNGYFYYRSCAYYTDESVKKHYYNSEAKTVIYKASKISLESTTYKYNKKVQKPAVILKDSKGNTIDTSNYTVKYPAGCKNVGAYKVTIKFKNRYSGTVYLSYKINPVGVDLKKVNGGNKKLTISWELNKTQTTGYQLQYSTNSKFKSGVKSVTLTNKTTSYVVKKLKANKKYYVRVRTYKKVGTKKYYSTWSDVMSDKTTGGN